MKRIAILGAPKTGKTTYANKLADESGCACRHTDDVMSMGWSESSAHVATWFDAEGDLLVEGVAVARALRKWMEAHPTGRPVDELLITSNAPFETHTSGQATMGKGINTVLAEIEPKLIARGVEVRRVDMRKA